MKKSIVISDTESISSFGNNINDIFNNLFIEKNYVKEKFNLISDFNFYSYHYNVKTRIDRCGQLCIHTTAQLRNDRSISEDKRGLITVSKHGCIVSKHNYLKQLRTLEDPEYASPKDFVQSISNIPNSLATIECGIKGFTNNYVGSSDASLLAIWQASKCLKDGMVDEMIVSSFDVLGENKIESLSRPNGQAKSIKYSEVAASIKIELEANSNENEALFEILGIGLGSGVETEEAVERSLYNAIKESDINQEEVSFVISNSNSLDEFYKNEKKGIERLFNNPVPTLLIKSYCGECFAAFPFFSISMLSKMSGHCLPNNLFELDDKHDSKCLIYNNVNIDKDCIGLIIGYSEVGNAVVICLKYKK